MIRKPKNDKQIEEAIKFLVFEFQKSGKNPKPVILHSIKIGLYLYNLNYDKNIVVAAILHDVIEDTDVEIKEVRLKFGNKVSKLVEANSFNKTIENKIERYKECFEECFERCRKLGKDALIIKAADILDNIHYFHLVSNKELAKCLLGKWKYFIDYSKNIIGDEIPYKELESQYNKILK